MAMRQVQPKFMRANDKNFDIAALRGIMQS